MGLCQGLQESCRDTDYAMAVSNENLRGAGYTFLYDEYVKLATLIMNRRMRSRTRWYERSVNTKVGDKHL